jgi:hypothetical protein
LLKQAHDELEKQIETGKNQLKFNKKALEKLIKEQS